MAIKQLGTQVLSKIQNLLSEIDKSYSKNRRKKVKTMHEQQLYDRSAQIQENGSKNQQYKRMSYIYLPKEKNLNKKRQAEVYEQQKQYQKFKIKNKMTIDILRKKSIQPIHERVNDILQKKQKFINQIKMNKEMEEVASMMPESMAKRLIQKKFNQKQFQNYIEEIGCKNKERIHKMHLNKIKQMNDQQKLVKIPVINNISRTLSCKRNFKQNFSENVFKRMQQYDAQRHLNQEKRLQKQIKIQGGFSPVLCPKSKQIVQQTLKNKRTSPNTHLFNCQSGKLEVDKLHLSVCLPSKRSAEIYQSSMSKSILNRSYDINIQKISRNKSKQASKQYNIKYSPLKNKTHSQIFDKNINFKQKMLKIKDQNTLNKSKDLGHSKSRSFYKKTVRK